MRGKAGRSSESLVSGNHERLHQMLCQLIPVVHGEIFQWMSENFNLDQEYQGVTKSDKLTV